MAATSRVLSRAGARLREGRASLPRGLAGFLMLLPSIALVVAFTIFPVLYNIWLSFYDKNALTTQASWAGLRNYRELLHDPQFWISVRLGVVYALSSTILQTVVGVAAALIL